MAEENPNKQKIIELREQGSSYGDLAKLFSLSRARIHQICSGYKNPGFNPKIKDLHNRIFVRDNFVCQWGINCEGKNISVRDLIIHYIDFNNKNGSSDNLITLCKFCHASFHSKNHIDEKIIKNLSINHTRKSRICSVCGKKFLPSGHSNRKTCSNECASSYRKTNKKSPEEKKKTQRERMMRYYNKVKNTPHYKEKQKEYSKKYYVNHKEAMDLKRKEHYQENIEKYKKYWREYHIRKKTKNQELIEK